MKQKNILLSVIVFAILTRSAIPSLFGHIPNFSALDALALFCGAYCSRRIMAIALCLLSVWVSDILLTHTMFYEGFYWQYGSYALITLLGTATFNRSSDVSLESRSRMQTLRRAQGHTGYITLAALTSATLFFIISNFGVWFSGTMYPYTIEGLIACYIAAIPFFKHTLISDLVFTGVLFGIMQIRSFRMQTTHTSSTVI